MEVDAEFEKWYSENPKANDPRPTPEVIAAALEASGFDARWEVLSVLHFRTDNGTFEAASALCSSRWARERVFGADILGQLGLRYDPFREERTDILIGLLHDRRVTVVQAAGSALGHVKAARAAEPLSRLKHHAHKDVRWSVVFGLLGVDDPLAHSTLIEMMEDEDSDVRDWATMGIGSMADEDTREIREALFKRLFDPDDDTSGEAMVGLARRKDNRVLEPLLNELKKRNAGNLLIEAAMELGDPRLYGLLLSLKQTEDADTSYLDEAIKRCTPVEAIAAPPVL